MEFILTNAGIQPSTNPSLLDMWRATQNSQHVLGVIFSNENCPLLIQVYSKFIPNGQINDTKAFVQIMDLCQADHKLLYE